MAISKRREEENQLPRERVRFNSGIKSENESSTRCLNKKKGPKNMFFKSQDYLQPSSSRACRPSRRRWACFFFICFIV